MKNLLRNLLAFIFLVSCALGMNAYDLVVTVNNPDLVNLMINYSSQTLNQGETRFENLSGYNYLCVYTANGGIIQKIVQNGETIENPTYVEMNMNDDYGISTFTLDITAVSQAEMPKSTFSVNVDNPARVSMSLEPKWQDVTGLQAGENTVEYIAGVHTYCTLTAPYGEAPIYKVETSVGTPTKYSDGTWEFDLHEGMNVNILADYPDEKVPVTFEFTGDGEGCISAIAINGETVTDFDPDNFEVLLGSKIQFTLNTDDYVINDFAYNNDHPYLGYSNIYTTYVTGPAVVKADAVKNRMVNISVNVNIGEGVVLYKGLYTGDGYPVISLKEGLNNIEVNASAPYLSLVAADGYIIDNVTLNGVKVAYDSDFSKYPLTVNEGDEVDITVSQIMRDQRIALFIDGYDKWSNFNMSVGSTSVRNLHNGYNELAYNIEELRSVGIYGSSWYYDSSEAQLYLNDVLQTPLYVGSFQFDLYDLKDGDVIKAYFDGAPATCNISFEIEEGIVLTDVCHDIVASFDPEQTLECFEGTQISFNSEASLKVLVNNKELSKEKDEPWSFIADGNTVVKISGDPVGITSASVSLTGKDTEIYTINGIRVNHSGFLPAGIYIINGKKVVISN